MNVPRTIFSVGTLIVVFGIGAQAAVAKEDAMKKYPTQGTIKRLDARLDQLIPLDAELEVLAGGFDWSEGPVWVAQDGGYLLCSDPIQNTIWKWDPEGGKSEFLKPSGSFVGDVSHWLEPGSNGLALDLEGNLVACDHGGRRVYRLEKDGKTKTSLVDRFEGKRFNSPNDLVFDSEGNLYFTDPPYGLMVRGQEGFSGRELDFCGIYRLSKDGHVSLLSKQMSRPNGITLSPDEKTLYVANSDPEQAIWMAFEIQKDGSLDEGRVFFDATQWVKTRKGLPDGLKADQHGNLFATGPGGVLIFSPDGTHLGTIDTGVNTGNCAWGGDGSVLYITADKNLCRIQTSTRRGR